MGYLSHANARSPAVSRMTPASLLDFGRPEVNSDSMVTATHTMTLSPDGLTDPWPDRVTVASNEFRQATGITREQFRHAMRVGVVKPVGLGRDGVWLFTKNDALLLLQAALIAAALSVAIAVVLRGVANGTISIPLPGTA